MSQFFTVYVSRRDRRHHPATPYGIFDDRVQALELARRINRQGRRLAAEVCESWTTKRVNA